VLINGVPANGSSGTLLGGGGGGRTFYEVLEGVNIFNIERVEVIRRLVPMYGDLGRNGVISIILKSGEQLQKEGNNFTLLKLQGFAPSLPFEVTESSRKFYPFLNPFRPTLYWNPSLTNDGSRLSIPIEFLLNEKSGPILVEVRGITELGEPIYGTFLLNEPLTKLPLEN
jgi:outer membrane receptor protein involved in Fe transport